MKHALRTGKCAYWKRSILLAVHSTTAMRSWTWKDIFVIQDTEVADWSMLLTKGCTKAVTAPPLLLLMSLRWDNPLWRPGRASSAFSYFYRSPHRSLAGVLVKRVVTVMLCLSALVVISGHIIYSLRVTWHSSSSHDYRDVELPALRGGIHRAAHTQCRTHTSPGRTAVK